MTQSITQMKETYPAHCTLSECAFHSFGVKLAYTREPIPLDLGVKLTQTGGLGSGRL